MKLTRKMTLLAFAGLFGLGSLECGGMDGLLQATGFVSKAEAVVGRPLTPVSGAGVVRRTTRRVIRRGAYIATIPANCHYGLYHGYNLYHCGGHYYEKSGSGYVVIYF